VPSGFITATPKLSTKMLAVMLDLWKKMSRLLWQKTKKSDVKLKRP
jgi:hypothetical protein